MRPDWELNLCPFGSQAGTQSTESQQPGQFSCTSDVVVGGSENRVYVCLHLEWESKISCFEEKKTVRKYLEILTPISVTSNNIQSVTLQEM